MRYGPLFLAGDAAHIVPPTGAKGLNLAMADVWRLADALDCVLHEWECGGSRDLLRSRAAACLARERLSWWMTSMLHKNDGETAFDERRQLAELDYLVSSRAAMTSLAESYSGAPLD